MFIKVKKWGWEEERISIRVNWIRDLFMNHPLIIFVFQKEWENISKSNDILLFNDKVLIKPTIN